MLDKDGFLQCPLVGMFVLGILGVVTGADADQAADCIGKGGAWVPRYRSPGLDPQQPKYPPR
jgi:hypothetical protein